VKVAALSRRRNGFETRVLDHYLVHGEKLPWLKPGIVTGANTQSPGIYVAFGGLPIAGKDIVVKLATAEHVFPGPIEQAI
jgi:hypothetical protein